jgi:hypothetical protein
MARSTTLNERLPSEVVSGGVENRDVFVAGYMDVFTPAPETTCGGRRSATDLHPCEL